MRDDSEKESSLVLMGLQALRSRIVRGEYVPGMRLKLDALQQSMRLSSSPLREALSRLVVEGLVETEEGKGFRVASVSIERFRELTHLRLLVEGNALRLSVEHGDDEWECRVVSAAHMLRRIEDRGSDSTIEDASEADEWSVRHQQFHMAMLSGSGYPRLTQMCTMFFEQAERYRRIALHSKQPRKRSIEHKKLAEAVLNRQADKAVELHAAHIQKTADRVAGVLEELAMQTSSIAV